MLLIIIMMKTLIVSSVATLRRVHAIVRTSFKEVMFAC